ncbi:ABC transporter, permease protein [Treponema primitia ZAS-2]|uniref:ABC transporter, permease protein n=1 Tax=Treponema primitia (strain ATCC BAA-887 / DSM 12427 / ZAS-2) TaxID=545694 RepID=F5YHF1_TREPZ|nr:ABC transporter permease [Treponema primitia]AEF86901.1 ABC transporter, permease protein [Treponema primitia ZAS-2]
MNRLNYILKRLLQMIPVLFVITVVVFLLIHFIPGDPARLLLGERAPISSVEAMREKLGLNQPLIVQYGIFMHNLAHFDLGVSIKYHTPVMELLGRRLSLTVALTLLSCLFAALVSLPLGYIAAVNKDKLPDQIIRGGALIALSVPTFWIALLLLIVFALRIRIFPIGGWGSTPLEHLRGLILPAFTLSLSTSALIMRNARNNIVDTARSDFVDFARSKGLKNNTVRMRHIIRNGLVSSVTLLSMQVAAMIGGSAITETVFNLPGIGKLMVESIFGRDYPVVQGTLLVTSFLIMSVNLLTDILYSALDPRVTLD